VQFLQLFNKKYAGSKNLLGNYFCSYFLDAEASFMVIRFHIMFFLRVLFLMFVITVTVRNLINYMT